ncbi:atrophin-1 [Fusarium beomiforme]|uniref:Atrophin-1 n=1 Tax=Fusarium beomiforme TaxID=44412 RepID=A0A9P5DV69_9HYPO|nr:atrophin-1 [Fusarium beomiforme]
MSPSPLKTPGSGAGAGDSEHASVVGSDRHQSPTTAAPTDSSNVDIGSVTQTSDQEQQEHQSLQQSPTHDIISSSPKNVHPLLQVASTPPHSRSTIAAADTNPATTTPITESPALPLGSSAQSPTNSAQLASGAAEGRASTSSNMIFSDIYKSPRSPIAKLRHHSVQLPTPLPTNTPDWYGEEHADLLSKDKVKQKEAVKRYLDAKVKNDWEFPWPSRVVEPPPVEGDIAVVDTASTESPDAIETVTSLDVTESTKPIQDETREDDGYQVDEPESDDDGGSDAESIYSTVSEDLVNFRTRLEWASDLSDDDDEPGPSRSPFRFDNPNNVGSTVQAAVQAKRAKRRRAVRKEMEWNEGLACFEARRNAWTGARTVRVRAKPASPPAVSPLSPRRFFFRRSMSMSTSPPSSTIASTLPPQVSDASDNSSLARSDELRNARSKDTTPSTPPDSRNYPVEVLLPLPPPLLPPNNTLRASITPSVYLSLYDKVIIHSLQPSCPINLSDMLRACVTGWKRDGEWPPRPTIAPAPVAKKKPKKPSNPSENTGSTVRRMSFGLLGRDKDDTTGGKGIRRSLVRALGIGEGTETPK